jgi:hypothetical protein
MPAVEIMSSTTTTTVPLPKTSVGSPQTAQMKISINLNERDIIKLIIEFLANRELNISMLDMERETGLINASFSDDILFLRQLILDGQWDDALEFIQPLKAIESFNVKQFYYLILKHQYLELLCLKSEANVVDNQLSVDQLVTYLNDLRQYCPNEDDYKLLCLLLTTPRLQDHSQFRSWNPSSGRLQCFKDCLPLIDKYLNNNNDNINLERVAQNERLIQLIVKGLLYESCVEYCQARATQTTESYNLSDKNILLMQQQLSETDASLLSWLHALPIDTFSCPFEEKPLKLNMERFTKPFLEAGSWADAILATPIKPQQLFPYSAVPTGRSRNMELMSRSLASQYDGLTFGLNRSQLFTSGIGMQLNNNDNIMNKSKGEIDINDINESISLINILDSNNNNNNRSTVRPHLNTALNDIKEECDGLSVQIQRKDQQSPTFPPTLNDLNEEETSSFKTSSIDGNKRNTNNSVGNMHDSTLFKEYKKNKAQIIQQIEEQERRRDEFVKQLKSKLFFLFFKILKSIFIHSN